MPESSDTSVTKPNIQALESIRSPLTFNGKGDVSHRIDTCIADFLTRNSIGIVVGVTFNFLLYRKPFRAWPICLAVGLASGYSLSNCKNSLKSAKTHSESVETTTAEEIDMP